MRLIETQETLPLAAWPHKLENGRVIHLFPGNPFAMTKLLERIKQLVQNEGQETLFLGALGLYALWAEPSIVWSPELSLQIDRDALLTREGEALKVELELILAELMLPSSQQLLGRIPQALLIGVAALAGKGLFEALLENSGGEGNG